MRNSVKTICFCKQKQGLRLLWSLAIDQKRDTKEIGYFYQHKQYKQKIQNNNIIVVGRIRSTIRNKIVKLSLGCLIRFCRSKMFGRLVRRFQIINC